MMYYGDTVHMWIFWGVGRRCGNFNIHVYLGHKVFNSTQKITLHVLVLGNLLGWGENNLGKQYL